jgi:hypothetical protein
VVHTSISGRVHNIEVPIKEGNVRSVRTEIVEIVRFNLRDLVDEIRGRQIDVGINIDFLWNYLVNEVVVARLGQ